MFRVDMENILRQYTNAYHERIRYPNPFNDADFETDDFESNEFRMYSFKIKKCPLNRAHDWTICPYAHQGERARRRDPRKVLYAAVSCPDYKASSSGKCPRGELCEFSHGVFEYWLHPTKYRTRVCNAGDCCTRSVCFFAHSPQELRVEPMAYIPNWFRLALRAKTEAETSNTLSSTSSSATRTSIIASSSTNRGRELGVIGRPKTSNTPTSALWELGSSSTTSSVVEMVRPTQELKLDFLESLRMMRISDYYNNQSNNVNNATNVKSDVPNLDWVTDLLAG
ncbi:hypothetical protein BVRB_3g068100 [Beta vulgaris subsp. vulgaris]|uniref:C3H1-type domain-containing protein n=1 Tax=Beta vulgaris subsp. vulgaris TaxID=3555 RepID=A0A0J8BFX8_BETVV|nr:hypothetical protein BVRB_3g068100 [Beta vulgaris subsp. vulgaris]